MRDLQKKYTEYRRDRNVAAAEEIQLQIQQKVRGMETTSLSDIIYPYNKLLTLS
jgi:hypothetical protein